MKLFQLKFFGNFAIWQTCLISACNPTQFQQDQSKKPASTRQPTTPELPSPESAADSSSNATVKSKPDGEPSFDSAMIDNSPKSASPPILPNQLAREQRKENAKEDILANEPVDIGGTFLVQQTCKYNLGEVRGDFQGKRAAYCQSYAVNDRGEEVEIAADNPSSMALANIRPKVKYGNRSAVDAPFSIEFQSSSKLIYEVYLDPNENEKPFVLTNLSVPLIIVQVKDIPVDGQPVPSHVASVDLNTEVVADIASTIGSNCSAQFSGTREVTPSIEFEFSEDAEISLYAEKLCGVEQISQIAQINVIEQTTSSSQAFSLPQTGSSPIDRKVVNRHLVKKGKVNFILVPGVDSLANENRDNFFIGKIIMNSSAPFKVMGNKIPISGLQSTVFTPGSTGL